MTAMGVYDQIKTAFQDIITPEVHALRGDIRVLDQKIIALDQKIDGVEAHLGAKIDGFDAHLGAKIDALATKIGGIDARLGTKIDTVGSRLDSLRTETVSMKNELLAEIRRVDVRIDSMDRELRTAIDIRERLAALEARRSP